jgi:hypothetical protein
VDPPLASGIRSCSRWNVPRLKTFCAPKACTKPAVSVGQ